MRADISIIVPVYQSESTLLVCLESVYHQEGVNIELVVVNDGGDAARINDVCASLPKSKTIETSVVDHSQNRGLLAARISGVEVATGQFLMHLDADDKLMPNVLSDVLSEMRSKQATCSLFSVLEQVGGETRPVSFGLELGNAQASPQSLLDRIYASHGDDWLWHVAWNKVWDREKLSHVIKNLPIAEHLVMYEDLLISLICMSNLSEKDVILLSDETFGLVYVRSEYSVTKRVKTHKAIVKNCRDTLFVIRYLQQNLVISDEHRSNVVKMYEHMIDKNLPPLWMLKSYPKDFLILLFLIVRTVKIGYVWQKFKTQIFK